MILSCLQLLSMLYERFKREAAFKLKAGRRRKVGGFSAVDSTLFSKQPVISLLYAL